MALELDDIRLANNQRFILKGRVLASTTSSNSGTWIRIYGRYPVTICVGGTATSLLWRVLVSNAVDQPTSNNEAQIGSDQSSRGVIQLDAPYEWINVVPATVSGGTVYADIFAG